MWTHESGGAWRVFDHAGPGLETLASASPAVDQAVFLVNGPSEDDQIVATVVLTRRLAPAPLIVTAGSRHPSYTWRELVLKAGADRALLVSKPRKTRMRGTPPIEGSAELGENLCPELHALRDPKTPLSVCGRRRDRLVLARSHLDRWCLSCRNNCPHWRGGPRG